MNFQRVKLWPFSVPKPCETFPYDVLLLVVKWNIGVKKRHWDMWVIHNTTAFLALSKAYVSKCRNMTRRHRSMVDSALESWWIILLSSEKILVIRTHPEELHVVKCALHTHISTHYSPHGGQHMKPIISKGHSTGGFCFFSL